MSEDSSGKWPARCLLALLLAAAGPLNLAHGQPSGAEPLDHAIRQLRDLVPRSAGEFTAGRTGELLKAGVTVDRVAAEAGRADRLSDPAAILDAIRRLSSAKQALDRMLDDVFRQRVGFSELEPDKNRGELLRNYLRVASKLIDLSGRLQYQLGDTINYAAYRFAGQPALRDELIDELIVLKSGIGAAIMSWALLDPPPNTPNRAQPASPATKAKLLAMVAWSGRLDTLPVVARFLRTGQATSELAIVAAETVRQLGLPQDPRPGGNASLPPPAITAAELHRIIAGIDARRLNGDLTQRRSSLLEWLAGRIQRGVDADGYRLGSYEVRPGDWLLMRNSSPYNLFTDLSPGLFTHVSVVALERGSDGIGRMVVVEVSERAARVPANNVESVLNVPLYYMFVRHEDAAVSRKMGDVAASIIGNELEYDMSFETARVAELRGKPLAGRKIKTYCAGLPLLCAQETGLPREEFFPISESPAGGRLVENLKKVGLRFGTDFVSPTGILFGGQMRIIGRSEHVYAPGREIEQGIYDHFVAGLIDKTAVPTPTFFQTLRTRLAAASRTNPLLARALATAAGIHADSDLVTAAKTAAVLETLGEIADGNSSQFLDALLAVRGVPPDELAAMGRKPDEIERIGSLRTRHADLYRRVSQGGLAPRALSDELVSYYTERGKRQIDERFFASESKPTE